MPQSRCARFWLPAVCLVLLPLHPLAAQTAAAPPATPLFNAPANQKARAVAEQAVVALGGQAYLQARDHSGHGRIYSFDREGDLDSAGTVFWSFSRFPDADRIELTKQRDVVYIYNGEQGWQVTYRGVEPLKARQIREHDDLVQHSVEQVLRNWLRDPQTLMLDKGISLIEQRQVELVNFFNKRDMEVTIAFDLNTHLPVNETWKRRDPDGDEPISVSLSFGNYQMVEGINTPFEVQRYEDGKRTQQRYYQSASYVPLADSLFAPPVKHR